MFRKVLKVVGAVVLLLLVGVGIWTWRNWDLIQRVRFGGYHVHETVPPEIPAELDHPAVLVFSKTNAFRHEEAIPAANAMFDDLAKQNGWSLFKTENGAAFSPEILARFDAVVFSNASGDLFSPEQQQALKDYLENGGGYVGIHAAGDNSHQDWAWYMDAVIGTTFIGHPMKPQFQNATVHIEAPGHTAMAGLPADWQRTDEWYSFDKSPRARPGLDVLATLDESTYKQVGMFDEDLSMGKDHPIVWSRCVGKGRMLYSAMGHTAESFAEPEYRRLLSQALTWAMQRDNGACTPSVPPQPEETTP